jgi:thioesterase domain-containing protein
LSRSDGRDTRLLAFVVPTAGGDVAVIDTLRGVLRSALPGHMQPSRIITVDDIPLLPAGKVDERALLARALAPAGAAGMVEFSAEPPPSARSVAAVARAWRRVLDRASLRRDLRFNEAGGDSLRLLELVFHLERQCGANLPLDAFPAELPPSGFARALDRVAAAQSSASSGGPTVILIPGVGNDEPRLARFRMDCAPNLAIVPIDYGHWSQWVAPGFDFAMLLDRVVSQIETIAPTGPLLLAGYSLGGHVAYAAANRLTDAGRSIGLLAIFDTAAPLPLLLRPDTAPPLPLPARRMRQRVQGLVAAWNAGELPDAIAHAINWRLLRPNWGPVLRFAARFRDVRWPARFWFFLGGRLTRDLLRRVWVDWLTATTTTTAPALLVPVILFRARARDADDPADLGWTALCPNLAVHEVDGDHVSMFREPNLATLCADFKRLLASTRDRQATP